MGHMPIWDLQDDRLFQVLSEGQLLPIEDLEKVLPGIGQFRDLLLELALRLRETRRYCQFSAVEGKVDAGRVLEILDGH